MKNIHILPTDNPSRLYLHSNNELQLRTNIIRTSEDYLGTNQNIYITSDEEIKYNDYYLGDDNHIYCLVSTVNYNGKKIILTTDFTLAPDVHKIPDEFLEWFVKNPSCESVKIDLVPVNEFNSEITVGGYGFDKFIYKIIIPQKEPKQEYKYIGECKGNNDNGCFMESLGHDCGCFKRIQQEEPKQLTDLEIAMKLEEIDREEYKQETLEEEAEKYSREVWGVYYDDVHPDIAITQTQGEISVKDFSRGAKWQARRMYSEEDVIKILLAKNTELGIIEKTSEVVEFFEQFKKN